MLKKKLVALILIPVILVFGGLTAAVAAVTRPAEFAPKQATLSVVTGKVELKNAAGDWSTAVAGTEVRSGDQLRTGADGRAEVNLFDQGMARLDAATTVSFNDLRWSSDRPTTFIGSIGLESGRVWSKLLDFLSPESSYEVRTSTAVATVRGTAFDMRRLVQPDGKILEGIFVRDHRVEAMMTKPTGEREMVQVRSGERARMVWTADKVESMTHEPAELDSADRAWVEANAAADDQFQAEVERRALEEARRARAIDPDSMLSGLVPLAERLRLTVASGDEQEALRDRFAAGHLIDAYIAAQSGDEARAKTMLDWAGAFKGGDDQNDDDAAGRAMMLFGHRRRAVAGDLMEMMERAAPASVEGLDRAMERRKEFGEFDDDAASADEDLSTPETTDPTAPPAEETRKKNPETEPAGDEPTASEPAGEATDAGTAELDRTLEEIRAADEKDAAELAEFERRQQEEIRAAELAAGSADTVAAPRPTGLAVIGKRNILPGETVAFQAILTLSDGSSQDVTARVRWTASEDDLTGLPVGVMDGNIFRSSKSGGRAIVTASLADAGTELRAEAVVTALSLELP